MLVVSFPWHCNIVTELEL